MGGHWDTGPRGWADGAGPALGTARSVPALETYVPLSLLGLGGLHIALVGLGFLLPGAEVTPLRMLMGLAAFLVILSAVALLSWPRLAAHTHRVALAASLLLLALILARAAVRPDAPIAVAFAVHAAAVGFVLPSRRSFLMYGTAAVAGWSVVLVLRGLPEPALWTMALGVAAFVTSFGINTGVLLVRARDQELYSALEGERTELRDTNSWLSATMVSHRILDEAAREGVAVTREGRVVHVSGSFCTLVDRPRDEVLGRTVDEVLPGLREAITDRRDRLTTHGRPPRVLVWEERPAPEGSRGHRVLSIRDVTEADRSRQERERALLLLSEAERLAHVGSWEWNVATGEATWSNELYRIFGREPQAGPPDIDAYLSYVPEEERENLRLAAQKVVQEHRVIETRHHIVRSDGRRRTVEVRGQVIPDPLQEHTILRGIIRDVTDSEQGEERFRALIESAPDSMVIVDGSGRITLVNRQTERVFGYAREALIGQKIECLVPSDARERHVAHREAYQVAPVPRGMGVGGTLFGLRKDGTRIPVEISLSPLERDGEVFITAAIRDVSDRQRMAEADRIAFERLLKIQQLTEIDRMKTSLFNTASHELNTPLTPLKMQVYLLRSGHFGPVSEEQERSLDILDRNLERLIKLNKDILDVARLQSGHLELRRRTEDLARLCEDAVAAFVDTAKAKGISLSAQLDGHPLIDVDRVRIEQVLYNLLSNSLRYTPSGGSVCVRVGVQEEMGCVSVSDTGIGMTAEQMGRLFEPFSQVHDPDADRQQTGTGLGLFISREIARRHAGSLEVESDGPGRGSTFLLSLPLQPDVVPAAPPIASLLPEEEAL